KPNRVDVLAAKARVRVVRAGAGTQRRVNLILLVALALRRHQPNAVLSIQLAQRRDDQTTLLSWFHASPPFTTECFTSSNLLERKWKSSEFSSFSKILDVIYFWVYTPSYGKSTALGLQVRTLRARVGSLREDGRGA